MSRTILYARVSTSEQNIAIQRAQAEAAGFRIDDVVADDGVSGIAIALIDRPQGKRLFDMLRQGDTLVVRWVDRLGRNYQDVTDTIRTFMRRGVVIRTVINAMVFDGATQDPIAQAVRDALIAFMAATAQAQAEATREAQKAGIAAARAEPGKYLGRKPGYTAAQIALVQEHAARGDGTTAIARLTGLSRQTVIRIRQSPSDALGRLGRWNQGNIPAL